MNVSGGDIRSADCLMAERVRYHTRQGLMRPKQQGMADLRPFEICPTKESGS